MMGGDCEKGWLVDFKMMWFLVGSKELKASEHTNVLQPFQNVEFFLFFLLIQWFRRREFVKRVHVFNSLRIWCVGVFSTASSSRKLFNNAEHTPFCTIELLNLWKRHIECMGSLAMRLIFYCVLSRTLQQCFRISSEMIYSKMRNVFMGSIEPKATAPEFNVTSAPKYYIVHISWRICRSGTIYGECDTILIGLSN